MFGIGYIKQKVSSTLSGLGFVPMKSESGNAFELLYVPISEIFTDEKNFQNRESKFSERSVNNIINAVENGAFNWFAFDPVTLWENPQDGKKYILSGHSRTQAFRELSEKYPSLEVDGLKFNAIPAKVFKGSFENAKNLALNSNTLSSPETLVERAEYFRRKRAGLDSKSDLQKLKKQALKENNGQIIWDLSFLPADGQSIAALKSFKIDGQDSTENFLRLATIAQWIGKAFQIYPRLSKAHDRELFKFLNDGGFGSKSGQYFSFSALNDRLQPLYNKNVKNDNKIDSDGFYKEPFQIAAYKKSDKELDELAELKKEATTAERDLKKELKNLRDSGASKSEVFRIIEPYFNEWINKSLAWWQELDRTPKAESTSSLFGLSGKQLEILFPEVASNKELIAPSKGVQTSIPFEKVSKQLSFDFFNDSNNAAEFVEKISNKVAELDEKVKVLEAEVAQKAPEPETLTNAGVKITKLKDDNGKRFVYSPYSKKFVDFAKKYNAKWNCLSWSFDVDDMPAVKEKLREIYGTAGEKVPAVILKINNYNEEKVNDGLSLFDIPIAKAYGKNSGAKTSDNIRVIEGDFTSGGSMRHYKTIADHVTFLIKNVPETLLNRDDVKTAINEGWCEVIKYNNNLGKPTIKFEFESNDDLKNFLRENKENLIDSYIDISEDSTALKPLNGFVFSENTAVFNCPVSELNCMGFKPTYKKLSSYDDLIDKAKGGKTLVGYGFETATLEELNNACKYYKQVEKLATHLKADTPLQSAFNVWYFLHDNILYNYDTEGQEEIRTPARTWQDRFKGVDCDCLAVFTACLLYSMGYKPAFEIVGFNNNDCYSHIFVNLDGLAIDRVLPVFLKRPSGITKTFIMQIPVFELNGGADMLNDCELSGIYQSTLKKVGSKNATTADNVDFKKIQTLLCLQNSDSNAYKLASILMPFVSAIDDDGNYYFSDSTIADYAEKADNIISSFNTSGATKEDFNHFFNDFVSSFREISVECNTAKDAPFVSVTITNAAKPYTVEGNLIKKSLSSLNPQIAEFKEALLYIFALNLSDFASKYAVGFMPESDAAECGFDKESWLQACKAVEYLFEFWKLLGGNTETLLTTIKEGALGTSLSGCKALSGVNTTDMDINAEMAFSRLGFIGSKILNKDKIIKDSKNLVVNDSLDSAAGEEPELYKKIQDALSDVYNNSDDSVKDDSLLTANAEEQIFGEKPAVNISNPGLWIAAASALGLAAFALSNNNKKR